MARLLTFLDWESISVSSNRVRNIVLDWIQGLIARAGPDKVYLPYMLSTDRRVLFVEPDPIWFNFLKRRSDNQTVLTDYSVDSWRVDDDPLHLYDFNEGQIHFAYPNVLEAMEKMILSGQQDDYVILWVTTSSDTRMLEAMGSYHAKAVKVVIGIGGPDKGYEEVFREAQDPENWIGYKGERSENIPIEPRKSTAPVDKSVEGLYNVLTNINDCVINRRCEDLLLLE